MRRLSARAADIALAARFQTVFVHYDGGQPEEPSLTAAIQVVRDVWCVPSAATGQDLSSWLHMGNWQLYARKDPLTELCDLCRADEAGVRRFVREAGVSFIVDAFHDNAHWTIGLQVEPQDA